MMMMVGFLSGCAGQRLLLLRTRNPPSSRASPLLRLLILAIVSGGPFSANQIHKLKAGRASYVGVSQGIIQLTLTAGTYFVYIF